MQQPKKELEVVLFTKAKVRLIFTHKKGNPKLHQWFREAKKFLAHQKKPHSTVDNPGCRKCGKCRVSCPVMEEGGKFQSKNTVKKYPIRKKLNCDSIDR